MTDVTAALAAALDLARTLAVNLEIRYIESTGMFEASLVGVGAGEYWEGAYSSDLGFTLCSLVDAYKRCPRPWDEPNK